MRTLLSKFKFPSAFTILFGLIIIVSALTWVIPPGKYERKMDESLGYEVAVPGTYKIVDRNPQGIDDILMAPIAGFYDPESNKANAIDIAVFVLFVGGFLSVVSRTGALSACISWTMERFKGREKWMIPILMGFFATGGTVYGMSEETLAFYMLVIPTMIAVGYDTVTGVAVTMIGSGIGYVGSTINPFATGIASKAAAIPFTDGIILRFLLLMASWLVCAFFVLRYAERVKRDPSQSVVADMKNANELHFMSRHHTGLKTEFTRVHKLVLLVFGGSFVVLIWGVSTGRWWMGEMSALFLTASIIVAIIARMGEREYTETFVDGARDLLGVALIIGVARGIVVIMDRGNITDTVLFWSAQAVEGFSKVTFINLMYGFHAVLTFFVPSSSGLAVLTMPIMAPLADFAGVERQLVVTAYQSATGLVNLINPTFAVLMGGLAIGRVPYDRWLRFIWPLLLLLTILIIATLSIGAIVN